LKEERPKYKNMSSMDDNHKSHKGCTLVLKF
jgi:hypothetical protein